jgi:hypothetical protein
LENTHRYRPGKAHALTKLGITLFSKELRPRHHAARLSAVAFDLGDVNTNFGLVSGSRMRAVCRILFFPTYGVGVGFSSCPNNTITTNR